MKTPNADATIDVIGGAQMYGEILARYIVADYPVIDLAEMTESASSEFFALAQQIRSEVALGVKVERE